jgi:hypothetical protein
LKNCLNQSCNHNDDKKKNKRDKALSLTTGISDLCTYKFNNIEMGTLYRTSWLGLFETLCVKWIFDHVVLLGMSDACLTLRQTYPMTAGVEN